jgi:hypothetical protein
MDDFLLDSSSLVGHPEAKTLRATNSSRAAALQLPALLILVRIPHQGAEDRGVRGTPPADARRMVSTSEVVPTSRGVQESEVTIFFSDIASGAYDLSQASGKLFQPDVRLSTHLWYARPAAMASP